MLTICYHIKSFNMFCESYLIKPLSLFDDYWTNSFEALFLSPFEGFQSHGATPSSHHPSPGSPQPGQGPLAGRFPARKSLGYPFILGWFISGKIPI